MGPTKQKDRLLPTGSMGLVDDAYLHSFIKDQKTTIHYTIDQSYGFDERWVIVPDSDSDSAQNPELKTKETWRQHQGLS